MMVTQEEEGGGVEEPPDMESIEEELPDPHSADLSHIEEEVSHRGAPITLHRSGLHSVSDSDTEVEAEWQEVEGRRRRKERRRRHQIDGENNHRALLILRHGGQEVVRRRIGRESVGRVWGYC